MIYMPIYVYLPHDRIYPISASRKLLDTSERKQWNFIGLWLGSIIPKARLEHPKSWPDRAPGRQKCSMLLYCLQWPKTTTHGRRLAEVSIFYSVYSNLGFIFGWELETPSSVFVLFHIFPSQTSIRNTKYRDITVAFCSSIFTTPTLWDTFPIHQRSVVLNSLQLLH